MRRNWLLVLAVLAMLAPFLAWGQQALWPAGNVIVERSTQNYTPESAAECNTPDDATCVEAHLQGIDTALAGGGGGGGVNVPLDSDGNGLADTILLGDLDGDGVLSDQDINGNGAVRTCGDAECVGGASCNAPTDACSAMSVLPDAFRLIELVAGEWNADLNDSGTGDTATTSGRDCHVVLDSNTVLRGAGRYLTKLRLRLGHPVQFGFGAATIVCNAFTGTTQDSGVRTEKVGLFDMTVGTQATRNDAATVISAKMGVQFWDCDECSVENVHAEKVTHAGFHLTRVTNTWTDNTSSDITAGYDMDGTGPDETGSLQASHYIYTSDGFINRNSGHRNFRDTRVGGWAINVRQGDPARRAAPFGEDNLTASRCVAQVFQIPLHNQKVAGIFLDVGRSGSTTPSGNTRVCIQGTTGSVPNGVCETGYDFTDFTELVPQVHPGSSTWNFFESVSDYATRPQLLTGTSYAAVLCADTASQVAVGYDNDAGTDSYPDGDAVSGTDETTWGAALTNQDLNFQVSVGTMRDVEVSDCYSLDHSGKNTTDGEDALLVTAGIGAEIKNCVFEQSNGAIVSAGNLLLGTRLIDVDFLNSRPFVTGATNLVRIGAGCVDCGIQGGIYEGPVALATNTGTIGLSGYRSSVHRATLLHSPTYGIRIGSGSRDVSVTDSTLDGGNTAIAIDSAVAVGGIPQDSRGAIISDNRITNMIVGVKPLSATSLVTNATIRNNTFRDIRQDAITFNMTASATPYVQGLLIEGNLIYEYSLQAGFFGVRIQGGVHDFVIGDNIFSRTSGSVQRSIYLQLFDADQSRVPFNGVVTNNLAWGAGINSTPIWLRYHDNGPGTDPSGTAMERNMQLLNNQGMSEPSRSPNVLSGRGSPTTSTVCKVGDLYSDRVNATLWMCTGFTPTSTYLWAQVYP